MNLPIEDCLGEIVSLMCDSIPVVLQAPPGAGKTTGVPPALLDAGLADDGQLLLVQPRRIAARTSAHRLAQIVGCKLGQDVGYHIRFDRCFGDATKLVAVTTGMLLRRLQSDPLLENVSCVLLDEFHERSLEMDLALGMIQRIRTTLRPELRLAIMSATLEPEPIVDFLGQAKAVESLGRAFPVRIEYVDADPQQSAAMRVDSIVTDVLDQATGDVLVFLPGVAEIRRTQDLIQHRLGTDTRILQLYGDLPIERQEEVFAPSRQRKIVLATNVAETSITIPGITAVVDTGLAKVQRFDSATGLPKLVTETISQASADQRAGRAGRTAPGCCWRLWAKAGHRARPERDTAEILRTDLSGAVLTLAGWGEKQVTAFPWLTPPNESAVEAAIRLLDRIGAIDSDRQLTSVGEQMFCLPLHPRIARFLLSAAQRGVAKSATVAAALLTERDPFRGEEVSSGWQDSQAECDLTAKITQLQNARATPAIKQVRRVAESLFRDLQKMDSDIESTDRGDHSDFIRALLDAFPDRLAKRRGRDDDRGLMVGGRGVQLDRSSRVRQSELFLCLNVDSAGSQARVRVASGVQEDWLPEPLVKLRDETFFDQTSESLVARRRRYFIDLMLSETPIACECGPQARDQLVAAARQSGWLEQLVLSPPLESLVNRIQFVIDQVPEFELSLSIDEMLDEVLSQLCLSRTSMQDLRQAPWVEHLQGRFDYQQLQRINQLAPPQITVPSGSAIRVRYAPGHPPSMQVRIQELFGWAAGPRVAGGKIAVQLQLLGPNGRPQQITDDLASFWKVTYPEVRKELRRRYAKHHWPDDPANATATRNGLKPRT